ncbi:MAG: DUF3987 domain-containing protein [Planctomycetales bacterium]|nr:DUF3987 domain-containing protein [Planctomycetales bacterium]
MSPTERMLAALSDRNCDPKPSGKGFLCLCPAHDDKNPSLSVSAGDDGRVLLKCHAGCNSESIVSALGLKMADLFAKTGAEPRERIFGNRSQNSQNSVSLLNTSQSIEHIESADEQKETVAKSQIVATYDYRDEAGNLLFQVVRFDPKDFRQRKPKPGGGWDWSVKGVRAVPYRLPELLAEPTRPVVVAEGEKDADNLARLGVLATCNAGGAKKWTTEHSEFLRDRRAIVLPDNDDAGRNHAQQVAQSLHGIAASVRIVELPDMPAKGDVSDWIAAGGTKDRLIELAQAAQNWEPGQASWLEIVPFDVLDLPEFPTHALPAVLRHWVTEESHATQTPADLAALMSLAVCSACIGRRVVVEPRSGWREPVNLFTAVLLEPGNRKSAVFADAMKPLREFEAELIEAARPEVARAQSERRQEEALLKKLERRAVEKGDAEARHQAGELSAAMADQPAHVLPRLLVDDATAEKMGIMLAEQGGRIASMSPEGGVFDLMAGLYSKSGMPQFGVYLMGHSADDLITDRVGRQSVRVERPALTCAYAMQPAVIEGLAENTAFRGRGLLARFLYAAPQSWIGRREIAPAPVSDSTRAAYHQIVQSLAKVEGEIVLQLSAEAAASLRNWEAEIEGMLADGGQMEIMRDWGAKLAGATLRLAAVLHCVARGPTGHIESPAIAAAVEIARYLIPHAEAVLNKMLASEDSTSDDARYVLRWIERHGRTEFTKREAQQHGKRRFKTANDIDPVLAELVKRGYILLLPTKASGAGRPPSPAYEVNPEFVATFDTERSQNSQNSNCEWENSNSENIENVLEHSKKPERVRVTI